MSALVALHTMVEIYNKILSGEITEEKGRKKIYQVLEEHLDDFKDE